MNADIDFWIIRNEGYLHSQSPTGWTQLNPEEYNSEQLPVILQDPLLLIPGNSRKFLADLFGGSWDENKHRILLDSV